MRERWFAGTRALGKTIVVPYTFQSKLSGIGDTAFHDVVWYRRTFTVPSGWQGRRVLLNFGAVDYECVVWINGETAGRHRGGHSSFVLDITDRLKAGDNVVVVRVYDPATDMTIPRGKQYLEAEVGDASSTRARQGCGSRCGLKPRERLASDGCELRRTSTSRRRASRPTSCPRCNRRPGRVSRRRSGCA